MLLFFNLQGSNKRFDKMPRKIAVPPEESIPVVKRFMKQFEIEPLPAWSAKVWKEMSVALGGKWSAAACYTNVRNDRNSILSIAGQEMGVFAPSKLDHNNNLNIESSMSTVQFDSNESYTDLSIEENRFLDTFDLVLTDQQWNAIKPDDIECSSRAKLKPGMWTNEIAISFFKQYRLLCAFVFKRAEVILSQNDIYTIKITGSCKSKKCRNTFRGYAEKEIGVEGLRVQITTRDTRTENHEVVKRPLNGKRRKEVQKELKAEGSSEWRKRQAREIMRPNETEPPILPSGDVLRQAHKEGVDAGLGVKENDGRDLVRPIEEMSLKPQYIGLIHDVGSLPFHVCYSTQAQLHAYKEYCRLNKNKSVISLDSTGSVVRRLDRKSQKSGHIFLYAIVINFDNTTISVYQMLKTEVNKENMCFDESISKMIENKRKILHDIFAKLIEPNGEEKTHFDQSASNKLDSLIKSPEQPVILKKYEHTEDKSCPVEMSPNNIEDQSCDSDLLTNKNWQENIEINELDCLNLDFNIDDVSNFIEMPSNDVESYLDSDLLATENWRGKVNINNNNYDYDDFNEESVNDHIVSDIAPSLTGSRELEIINIKSSNEALLDHSYSSMNSSTVQNYLS